MLIDCRPIPLTERERPGKPPSTHYPPPPATAYSSFSFPSPFLSSFVHSFLILFSQLAVGLAVRPLKAPTFVSPPIHPPAEPHSSYSATYRTSVVAFLPPVARPQSGTRVWAHQPLGYLIIPVLSYLPSAPRLLVPDSETLALQKPTHPVVPVLRTSLSTLDPHLTSNIAGNRCTLL